jgi:hypothetical protein
MPFTNEADDSPSSAADARPSSGADVLNDHFHRAFVQHEEVARLDQLLATVRDVMRTWIGLLVFVPFVARMMRPSVGAAVFIAVKSRSPMGAISVRSGLHRAVAR